MSININVNNNWKEASGSYCKVNGVWRKVNKICKNIGGEWKCTGFESNVTCSKIYLNENDFNLSDSTKEELSTYDIYYKCTNIPSSYDDYNASENIRYEVGKSYKEYFLNKRSYGDPLKIAYDIDSYNFYDDSLNTPVDESYFINKIYKKDGAQTMTVFFCKPISNFIILEVKESKGVSTRFIGKFEKLN